jgi:predicted PurR-regulated permease PerM
MDPKDRVDTVLELIWHVVLRVIIWAGLAYFLYRVRGVITAVIIAAVLSYALLPLVDFLCSYRVRGLGRKPQRFFATFLVFVMLFSVTAIAIKACIKPFQVEFAGVVSNLDASKLNSGLNNALQKTDKWARQFPVLYDAIPSDAKRFLNPASADAQPTSVASGGKSQQQPKTPQAFAGIGSAVAKWTGDAVKASVGYLFRIVDLILIPVLAFYFILDSRSLKREFVALAPRRRAREVLGMLHEVNGIMRSYIRGQIILCVIAGVIVGLLLKLFDMQYVLILSVFAGITRAIPVVGPVFSGAAIVVLALAKDPILGVYLLVAFGALHFVESKFIMPKLIGDRMQLHPAMVIIVLLIGAEFFGIFGMFMAAPVAAVIRVLVRYYLIKPKKLHVWGLTHEEHPAPESMESLDELPLRAAAGE